MFRTWNMKFLDLWRRKFHPGCQSCILLGYMNSLWDVGIRSDLTWRETLFEPWQKNFDLFVKTAVYVSKGTIWVKKQLLKVLIFFKLFRILNEHSPCLAKIFSAGISKLKIAVFVSKIQSKNQTSQSSLFFQFFKLWTNIYRVWRKTFREGYQNWKLQSSSQKINQKTKLLKLLFFSNSSELWTNIYRAWRETFRQGYQNWKMQSSSQKINQKTKLLKVLMFFQTLQVFERTFAVLGEKFLSRDIKFENCSLRLKSSIKKPNFSKFSFFSNSSKLWTNIYRVWRKTFRQGYQNWKLQSSSQKINQKTKLLKVLMFFQTVQVFERTFTVLGEKVFSRVIKFESCSLRLKSSIKKPNFSKFSFFPILPNFERTFTVFGEKLFGRDIKIENCSLRLKRSIKNQTSESSLFFPILQKLERTFTVFCEKLFGRDIKIENCSLRLIRSNKKSNFWKFSFFFEVFRTLNEHLPCLAKKIRAGVSNLKIVLYVFRVSIWE